MINSESILSLEERIKHTPVNKGQWSGKRGNSRFYTDKKEVKKMGADYVEYENGEPDFSRFSRITVTIPSMTDDRRPYSSYYKCNYEQAYTQIAKQKGMTEKEAKHWLKENNLVLHEACDMKTIQAIPRIIHSTYIHTGGVAECKAYLEAEENDELCDEVCE